MAMAAGDQVIITKLGILQFGADLPKESSISSYVKDETVVQLSCGINHSAIVCGSGRVYTFGKNQDNGWMKNDPDVVADPSPVAALDSVKIIQAACGKEFTIFLTNIGQVYSCGLNTQGQLGLGHTTNSPLPVLVTGLPAITMVAAGITHTVALSDSGEVWVSGYNNYGQLGLGNQVNQISFTSVPNIPVVRNISCGGNFTAILSSSQCLLCAGSNYYGQLGIGKSIDYSWSFIPVSLPSIALSAVVCGSFHAVALTVDGIAWAWGSNESGQLGTGNILGPTIYHPTKMFGLKNYHISKVVAGGDHTALLSEEGNVLVCGKGVDGELGLEKEILVVATLLPKSPELVVQQVALASNYSLLLIGSKQNDEVVSKQQVEKAAPGEKARGGTPITDLEKSIMRSLECPVCFKIMCAPIHQCIKGHSLCGTCRSHPDTTVCPLCREHFSMTKNIALESLSVDIQLPCVDCLERMPASLLERHGEECIERKYSCPIQQPCGWSGRPETMLAHMSSTHPDQTWRDLPHLFVHSTSDEVMHTDLLAAHGEVFTLLRRYNKATRLFQAAVKYIGSPKNRHKYKFELAFLIDDIDVTFHQNMCADTEKIEIMFQNAGTSVQISGKMLRMFLKEDKLVCQVAILPGGCGDRAARVKALLIA